MVGTSSAIRAEVGFQQYTVFEQDVSLVGVEDADNLHAANSSSSCAGTLVSR